MAFLLFLFLGVVVVYNIFLHALQVLVIITAIEQVIDNFFFQVIVDLANPLNLIFFEE